MFERLYLRCNWHYPPRKRQLDHFEGLGINDRNVQSNIQAPDRRGHATSLKRLSKVDAAEDPTDGPDDE